MILLFLTLFFVFSFQEFIPKRKKGIIVATYDKEDIECRRNIQELEFFASYHCAPTSDVKAYTYDELINKTAFLIKYFTKDDPECTKKPFKEMVQQFRTCYPDPFSPERYKMNVLVTGDPHSIWDIFEWFSRFYIKTTFSYVGKDCTGDVNWVKAVPYTRDCETYSCNDKNEKVLCDHFSSSLKDTKLLLAKLDQQIVEEYGFGDDTDLDNGKSSECAPSKSKELQRKDIMATYFQYLRSQVLSVGIKLEVFDHFIDDEILSSDVIAERLQLNKDLTFRWLRGLAFLDVLKHHAGERLFSVTKKGSFLRKNHESAMWHAFHHIVVESTNRQAWAPENVIKMLKGEGESSFDLLHGMNLWEYHEKTPESFESFNLAMVALNKVPSQKDANMELLSMVDWNGGSVCDIGGGNGILLQHLLEVDGSVMAINFELDEFQDTPRLEGIDYRFGDFFQAETIPKDADFYLLKAILHDWDDEKSVLILKNILNRAKKRSKVVIMENLIPEIVTKENGFSTMFDLYLMVLANGEDRTAKNYQNLLEKGGWDFETVLSIDIDPSDDKGAKGSVKRRGLVIGVKK